MRLLHIDIETYSDVDLKTCGLYKYVESLNFEILLIAYSFGDHINVVDLAQGEQIPKEVLEALTDSNVIKVAHNAAFEMMCLDKYLSRAAVIGPKFKAIDPSQWRCTMVMGYYLGLPGSLDNVAKALKLSQEKMAGGKALVNYFSKPCRPTKSNANRTRNLPAHDPDKWQLFKDYNVQDVQVEMLIYDALKQYDLPKHEWDLWVLDQKINIRGVDLDETFIRGALKCDTESTMALTNEALSLTGLDNPNSPAQLKAWIEKEEGIEVPSIAKSVIDSLEVKSPKVKRMIELRQMMSKTSTAKYATMDSAMCLDGRARGLLQFYGASKTGRWAGRLIQVQNLPRNYLKDLDDARNIVKSGNYSLLELLYGDVPDTLSQLIRTAFIPSEGRKLIVVDFSAIEARVIAWLADEKWRNEVFASHGKIYEASASQMFNIPLNEITPELRQKGKVAELALGYQGSTGALIQMGALNLGLAEHELQGLVNAWRNANSNITKLWSEVQSKAQETITTGLTTYLNHGVSISKHAGVLAINLPSGRSLYYLNARLDGWRIYYDGVGTNNKWEKISAYGGKLTENIVQAIARDCLAEALVRVDNRGWETVMHIHDEIVIDALPELTVEEVVEEITKPIKWAKGLKLNADGFEASYYQKD